MRNISKFSNKLLNFRIPFKNSYIILECSNAIPQRNTSSASTTLSQISQWDEMTVERGGKFSKPAPQCIHWNNPKHRLDFPCRFWHPREQCR